MNCREDGIEVTAQQLQYQQAGDDMPLWIVPSTELMTEMDEAKMMISSQKEREQQEIEHLILMYLWHGLAGFSFVVNIVAMAIEQSAVTMVAGLIALLLATVVIVEQFELLDLNCTFSVSPNFENRRMQSKSRSNSRSIMFRHSNESSIRPLTLGCSA